VSRKAAAHDSRLTGAELSAAAALAGVYFLRMLGLFLILRLKSW